MTATVLGLDDKVSVSGDTMTGALTVPSLTVTGQLNANSDFETGLAPWTNGAGTSSFTQSSTFAYKGTYSARVVPDGVSLLAYFQSELIACPANAPFTVQAWILCPTGYSPGAGYGASVSVNWYDASMNYLSTSYNYISLAAGVWTPYVTTYTSPANAAFLSIDPNLQGSAAPPATAITYWDLVKVAPASTQYLASVVAEQLQIPAAGAAGKVLTADAYGNATWQGAAGVGITDWINVKASPYSAYGDGSHDDTTAINAAISAAALAGGVVYFPQGTYKISAALNLASYVALMGAGSGVSAIRQTSTTLNGLTGTDLTNVAIRGLSITGPASGSGVGVNMALGVNSDTNYVIMDDVRVASFGSHGIQLQSPIVSRFSRVNVTSNGADAWHVFGSGTSCHWDACYALNNSAGIGYHLIGLSYSTLAGCAADSNVDGYSLSGCVDVALSGCGAESSTTDGYILSGGSGNSLTSCFVYGNVHYGIHLTGGEVNATLASCVEHNPSGATAFIITDAGTSAVVVNRNGVTVDSFAAGTYYQVNPAGTSGETWAPEDNGLLTAVGDPYITQGTSTLIAGTIYLEKLVIRRNMTVSNVWFLVNSAGSGASTGSFAGLYSSAGTLLSGSADIAAKLTATGPQSVALTTPQALTAGSFVWVAIVSNLATTQPGLHSGNASINQSNINLAAASYRFATNGTGQLTLPASITPSSNSQTAAFSVWAGAS